MPVPREGDTLCSTGAVMLRGRRGVIHRRGPRSTWNEGQCTWCGKPVPKGRRKTWCSQWCVDAYQATQPEHQRRLVLERDRARCSSCGLDCERFHRALRRWRRLLYRSEHPRWHEHMAEVLALRDRPCSTRQLGAWLGRRNMWDVDHVVPIWEGGHPYDLRNLRTLCPWCHDRETTEGTARRAGRRRGDRVVDDGRQVGLFGDGQPC